MKLLPWSRGKTALVGVMSGFFSLIFIFFLEDDRYFNMLSVPFIIVGLTVPMGARTYTFDNFTSKEDTKVVTGKNFLQFSAIGFMVALLITFLFYLYLKVVS